MRTLSDKTCRENQNTLIFKSFHLSDNVEKCVTQPDRPQTIKYSAEHMQYACQITARIQTKIHNI